MGQFVRGDVDEAEKNLRPTLTGRTSSRRVNYAKSSHQTGRLRLVPLKICGTNIEALLNCGAIPNFISAALTEDHSLHPVPTNKKITVANGTTTIARGVLHDVPVKFESVLIPLEFLVVEKSLFNVITGCPTLEKLGACIDHGTSEVSLTSNGKSTTLRLDQEQGRAEQLQKRSGTDNEDFTSDSKKCLSDSRSELDNERIDTMLFK